MVVAEKAGCLGFLGLGPLNPKPGSRFPNRMGLGACLGAGHLGRGVSGNKVRACMGN